MAQDIWEDEEVMGWSVLLIVQHVSVVNADGLDP